MTETAAKLRDSYHLYKLRKEIEFLRQKKGFHTELITLYIPPDRNLDQVMSYLKNEISESQNIKSKLTRKNVLDSITTLIQRMKLIKSVGETGLVMMAGAIPQGNSPGTEKIEFYTIFPPEPIRSFRYHCASEFLLDPLDGMLVDKNPYGLITVGHKEAAIGWIRGTHLNVVRSLTSGVHGKFRAGGQSQRRFERLREEGVHRFYQRVAEVANEVFLEMDDLKGIFIGGLGFGKQEFLDKHMMDYRLEEKVIDLVDTDYSGEEGIRSLLYRIQHRLENVRFIEEKKLVQDFLQKVSKDDELVTYGEREVRDALLRGQIDKMLLSAALNLVRVNVKCESCGYTEGHTVKEEKVPEIEGRIGAQDCPECQSHLLRINSMHSVIDELGEIAETVGTDVQVISTDTEEGQTLWNTFGGLAAFLRYA